MTEYGWDERDLLREVRKPSGERVLFVYDAFGRRMRKEVLHRKEQGAQRVVEFLWDKNELAAESDSHRGRGSSCTSRERSCRCSRLSKARYSRW